jgi:hypothetical protein
MNMANILKRDNADTNGSAFIDRTMENWYCKEDESKVYFCNSVYDIIAGKTEPFVYTKMEKSVKKGKNEEGGVAERSRYVLFVLGDNNKVLVKARGELK